MLDHASLALNFEHFQELTLPGRIQAGLPTQRFRELVMGITY